MIFGVYAVRDAKAGAFLPPFVYHAKGMAVRIFGDCCRDDSHQWGKHPEDYSLYRLANWDDESGLYDLPKEPELVVSGLQAAGPQG